MINQKNSAELHPDQNGSADKIFLLKDPGLVSNGPDGMSCLHACVQMILGTKEGGATLSFEDIDKILRRKPGQYSWWYGVSAALCDLGFEICVQSAFLIQRFIEEGESYLFEFLGEAAAQKQIAKVTIANVREDAKRFLASTNAKVTTAIPTLDDIKQYIRDGWYLVTNVNSALLKQQPGYSPHFIFVFGYNDESIIFHDPGLPSVAARKIPWELFDSAWSFPQKGNRSMWCFKAKHINTQVS